MDFTTGKYLLCGNRSPAALREGVGVERQRADMYLILWNVSRKCELTILGEVRKKCPPWGWHGVGAGAMRSFLTGVGLVSFFYFGFGIRLTETSRKGNAICEIVGRM